MQKQVESIQFHEILFIDKYYTLYSGHDISTNTPVIIRSISREKCAGIQNIETIIQDEVNLLRTHLSRSIIHPKQLIGTSRHYYIVYEHCSVGLLETELKKKKFFPEEVAISLLEQLMDAYDVLIKGGVVVRSFRLDSIMLCDHNILKLFDIGLVRNLEKFDNSSTQPSAKLLFSLAPEIIQNKTSDSRSDFWGIGLIFYQMLFGSMPWPGAAPQEYFKNMSKGDFTLDSKIQKVSPETADFLHKTLAVDPAKRADWTTLRNHKIFTLQPKNQYLLREVELHDELKTNPDSWKVESIYFTSDPLVSHVDLTTHLKSSYMKISKQADKSPFDFTKKDLEKIENEEAKHPEKPNGDLPVSKDSKNSKSDDAGSPNMEEETTPKLFKRSQTLEDLNGVDSFVTEKKKVTEEFEKLLEDEKPVEGKLDSKEAKVVFEQNKNRILAQLDKYHIYCTAATSACKLFKIDLILVTCYFFYKKFCNVVEKFYENLLAKKNILKLPHWDLFTESDAYFNVVEVVEARLKKASSIFKKLLIESKAKLKSEKLKLDTIVKYLNDSYEDASVPFDTIIYSYLTGTLENKDAKYDEASAYYIMKHKIEVVDALLMNKFPDISKDDEFFDFSKHKAIMKKKDMKSLSAYYQDKRSKLELIKYNSFSN